MGQFSKMDEKVLIRQGKPIKCLGLTFYPIQMCHYEEFLKCKNALAVRLSTLPVKYAIKDYINAIFTLEMDSVKEGKQTGGILIRILTLLKLSLRIDSFYEDKDKNFFEECVRFIQPDNETIEIESFILTQENEKVEISVVDFSTKIRTLIARQNGIELPDENENADLIQSQQEMEEIKTSAVKLNQSTDTLISSVAYNSRISEREIYDWTILEFENRRKAIERDKKYTLYAQAEMGGMVSFKKGNPYPSWCFDVIDDTAGTITLSEMQEKTKGISIKEQ